MCWITGKWDILRTQWGVDRWNALQWWEGTYWTYFQQKDTSPSEGCGCYPTDKALTHDYLCLKEKQGWKWRTAWGTESQNGDPAQMEAPTPDNITDAMGCSKKKRNYHDCLPNDNQQAAIRVRCTYVYPTNEQKLLSLLVKFGKRWRKVRRRASF